jgi:hypothetical protein
MNQRLLIGFLFASISMGCSGKSSTGTGSGGTPGASGGAGVGTGGNAAGTGGGSPGTGGSATGTGGGSPGTGGAPAGTGGAIGTGGGAGRAATGGVGTGGVAGGAGRTGTGGAGTGGAGGAGPSTGSVLERNNHPSRDGHFLQPTLTKARAPMMARDTAFTGTFTGGMWASPLYVENGPAGKGVFIAATLGNDVIALDETTGAMVWTKSIGAPSTSGATSGGQCNSGNIINPLGIVSTPVIDAQTRTIYAAGATGTAAGIGAHIATALSVDDGAIRAGWPVDVSTSVGFDPKVHSQRSALSLVGGILYVAYGGFIGDCGAYHGRIVGITAANPATRGAWATGGVGEGIWPAGGMASDGTGIFVSTGNSTNGAATHLDSEEIVRITGLATLDRTNANMYFPATWRTMDSTDADFSAVNPLYVEVPGATPSTMVVAIAKDGHMYLLDSKNLGGMAGHKADFMLSTGAMSIRTVPAAYTTPTGVHVALSVDSGAICPPGMPSGKVVMSVLIPAGAPPVPRVVWCTALTGTTTAPIATTTNGSGDAIVWFINNNRLVGVDGETGAMIVNPTDTCMNVRKWTSPIAVKGRIVAGGDGHLCSWSPH